jgi:transcriptional regulator with XRE-family HTH domain
VLTIPYGVNPRDHAYQRAYKEFTKRLVAARKNAGLTQVQVARRLGKSHTYVSKCELGERRVDFVELQRFAQIYSKDISFFITL